jgi:tetratricopeptide (TPR) repeat protein
MMAQAQAMMSKMSPEDMRRMQEIAKNMDPAMMREMQQQMQNNPAMMSQAAQAWEGMSPEQIRAQMQQASSLTPEQLRAAGPPGMPTTAAPALRPMSAAEQLRASPAAVPPALIALVDEAERIKSNGNKRFSAQDFDGAIAKYGSAISSLVEAEYATQLSGAELAAVVALVDSCDVNSATCYLRKGGAAGLAKAAECCSRVLERTPSHRKALYNRGKAYLAQNSLKEAVKDLKKALQQDKADDTVRQTLAEARARLDKASQEESGGPKEGVVESDDSDEEMPPLMSANATAPLPGTAAAASSGARPGGIAARASPADMAQAQQMMAQMTPEQISAQIDMMMAMDPEMLRNADPLVPRPPRPALARERTG